MQPLEKYTLTINLILLKTIYWYSSLHIKLKNPCNELVNIYNCKLTVTITLNTILFLGFRLNPRHQSKTAEGWYSLIYH